MAALDAEELERFAEQVDRVDRIARALPAAIHGGEHQQTTMIHNSAPAWLCVVAVVAALVWGLGKDGEKSDTLVSLQAQVTRQQGEIMDLRADIRELRATDNAVRAYINTGILKPKQSEKTK